MTIGLSILKHPFFDTLSQSTLKRNQNRHPIYAEFHAFFLVVAPIFIVFAMKQMVNERRRDKMWEQQRKDLLQLEIQQVKWAIARGAGSGSDAGVGKGFVLHSTWLLFCIYGLVTTIYRKSLRASKHLFWAYFILAQGVSFAIYSYIAFFKPTSPSSSLMHVNSTSGLDSFNTTSTTDTKVAKTKTIVIPLLLIDLLIHFVFRSFILYTIHQITKDLKKRESRKLFAQRIQENAPLILDLKH
ncbi:hypothetical protein EDD11_000078 [Mortierella claussenii]|nr:hypothetical protein EDD11_000078 [Mortierella claussenii]